MPMLKAEIHVLHRRWSGSVASDASVIMSETSCGLQQVIQDGMEWFLIQISCFKHERILSTHRVTQPSCQCPYTYLHTCHSLSTIRSIGYKTDA